MAPKKEDRFDSLFQYYGYAHDIPWLLLKSIVKAESQFDPMARSVAGATGLAQFMGPTFKEWSTRLGIASPNPYCCEHSIQCEAGYLRWLLDNFQQNTDRALGAYNYGVMNEMVHKPWPKETINYVAHVKQYWQEYDPAHA